MLYSTIVQMAGKFSVKLFFVSIMKAIYLLPTNNQTLRPKIVQHTKVVMFFFTWAVIRIKCDF